NCRRPCRPPPAGCVTLHPSGLSDPSVAGLPREVRVACYEASGPWPRPLLPVPPASPDTQPAPARSVPWHGLRFCHGPQQVSPAGPLDAPVPLESTSRQEHRLDPRLRLSRAVQPLLPSVAPLFYSHAHTTAHCGGWRWRGSWSHPAPPCPVSAHPSHGPVSGPRQTALRFP